MASEYSDSEFSGDEYQSYEFCARRRSSAIGLPFNPTSIENIILSISDKFNFRVLMQSDRARGAILVTTGMALAGGLLGKAYIGGKIGAAVGGAFGGACGIGIVAMSMRDVWNEIKPQLSEIFDIVYDYLSGLGIDNYAKAALFLANNSTDASALAKLILHTSADILGKEVISNLPA